MFIMNINSLRHTLIGLRIFNVLASTMASSICREEQNVRWGCSHKATAEAPYIKVRHAGLLEVIPQPPGDDVHRYVVGDHPAHTGHRGLVREGRTGMKRAHGEALVIPFKHAIK